MAKTPVYAFDVFLSHNRAQKDWTRDLARRLRDDGFNVWFDEWQLAKHLGDDFADHLSKGVEESRKVVLIWSPDFFANDWPQFEQAIIQHLDPIGRQGRIIPLLQTTCEIPAKWGFRQRLSFVDCPKGSLEFDFAYHVLVHNLDPERFFVPDPSRYRPEKLKFAREIRSVAKFWRWTSYLSGFAVLYCTVGCIAALGNPSPLARGLDLWLIGTALGLFLELTIAAVVIARGLRRLRPWARRAAILLSLCTSFYPLSWYTLWIVLRPRDSSALYKEIAGDAR
jgi:hypothetical protein